MTGTTNSDDGGSGLNRRRILVVLLTIGVAAAVAGAGTFAWFSDSSTSNNNDINAGTLSLNSTQDAQLGAANIVPNQTVGPNSISVQYESGSTVNAELDLRTDIKWYDESGLTDPHSNNTTAVEFADTLNVDTAIVDVGGSTTDLTTAPQSVSTLGDLDGQTFDSVDASVAPGTTIAFDLQYTMDKNAGNGFQADGATLEVEFIAEQPDED